MNQQIIPFFKLANFHNGNKYIKNILTKHKTRKKY